MKIFIFLLAVTYASAYATYVDLTYPLDHHTILWPGEEVKFYTIVDRPLPEGARLLVKGYCLSEHTSTHMDVPYHLYESGWKLDQFPVESFMDLPGVTIDIYDKVYKYDHGQLKVVSNYVLTKQDILDWEEKYGEIPPRALVLIRTGWGDRWPNRDDYYGLPEHLRGQPLHGNTTNLNFPGVGEDAARFLVSERQISGVGIDTLSIDAGQARTLPAQRILLKKNIFLIENIDKIHLLPAKGFRLFAFPFKVDGATGSPTRLIAKLAPADYPEYYGPY